MACVRVRPLQCLLIGLCGLLCIADGVNGQCQYEVTAIIEPPPCPPPFTQGPMHAQAINNHGEVVGYYEDCVTLKDEGFLWTPDDGLVTLPRPAGVVWMQPEDINDHGVICGTWGNSNAPGSRRGFVYWPDTQTYTELDTQSGGGWGMAHAINNSNVVVGERAVAAKAAPRIAYVWSQQDGFTDIGELAENESSSANAISESGIAVGWIGAKTFVWQDGALDVHGTANGASTSQFVSIGHRGDLPIVGTNDFSWPLTWDGTFDQLPLLPNHNRGAACVVQNRPTRIGGISRHLSTNPPVDDRRGVLWLAGQVYDINDWAIGAPEHIRIVVDINIHGVVLASAPGIGLVLNPLNASPGDVDGDCHTNRSDLQLLLTEWGKTESAADLNDSGRVDVFDLLCLLRQWTG